MKTKLAPTPQEIALLDACKNGDLSTVNTLLAEGVPVNCRDNRDDPWDMTPLMMASQGGQAEVVKALLNAKAKVNLKVKPDILGDGRYTALHFAVFGGSIEVAELLLKAKADINALTKDSCGTPLMAATQQKNEQMVSLLLKNGADVNAKSKGIGATALHIAVDNGDEVLISKFLEAGADVNSQSNIGETALMDALLRRRVSVCRMLFDNGANVHLADSSGFSTLMWAVVGKEASLVKEVMDKGAEINVLDEDGRSALDIAIRDKLPEIEALLRKGGSKTGAELKPPAGSVKKRGK